MIDNCIHFLNKRVKIMKEKVTFVLTSCGRVDLLDPTLESFFKKNSYRLEDLFWLKIQ